MWKLDSFTLAASVVTQVTKNRNIINPYDARDQAKYSTRNFYENICPKYWIEVEYSFWEKTIIDYPLIVEMIKEYIYIWENVQNLPLLWLWNHQAFGLEAVWVYDYFPLDWKVVLKDDLLKPPFFSRGIKSIDPIIHYRKKMGSDEFRKKEIKDQILKWKAVLIYPEWTRSKDWKIKNFKSSLYEVAYDFLKNENDISTKVALITSDTFKVLPNTLEKSLLFMWKINPWKITYTIDIVDIENYETIKKFNADIRNIIKWNLNN